MSQSDALDNIAEAIACLHAIRRAGNYATPQERYSFTNEADAPEVEKALDRLNEALRLLNRECESPAPDERVEVAGQVCHFLSDDRGCFIVAKGKYLNHAGTWDRWDELDEGNSWPTRSDAIAFAKQCAGREG